VILGKRLLTGTAALAAAVLVAILLLLPPLPVVAPSPSWRPSSPVIRGVFHVHTRRSDGTATVDEVAAAAAKAGLQFVILTDHGDGTRQPDAPAYRSGVLCIDAVEISTSGGHYAALGLGRAPYPLAGEPRDVAEDVRRLGGFGVVTHPLSAKPGLAWQGWAVPFDGIEWLNGDSLWRDAPLARLVRTAATYPFRPVASIASLYQRPAMLARYDVLAKDRRVVILSGADAHARLGLRDGPEPYANPVFLRVPSYQAAFEVASLRVRLPEALSRDAARDAESIVEAIRAGHLHTVVDALAAPAAFEFSAKSGSATASEGDSLPLSDPAIVRVRANTPADGSIVLFRDGVEVHRAAAGELVYASDRPGTYRAEVWLPSHGSEGFVPWIVGNPILAGKVQGPPAPPPIDMSGPLFRLASGDKLWGVERGPGSRAELDREGGGVALRYALAGRESAIPYAALNATTTIDSRATGIAFMGSADGPMRISVQLRVLTAGEGKRWRRSVYLDQSVRDVVIPFADMIPVGESLTGPPQVAGVRTVLFVVDSVNSKPLAAGRFALDNVRFFSPGNSIR